MQQRLADAQVGHQRVIRAETQAVIDAAGGGGINPESLVGRLLFIVGLDLADKVGLTRQ